VSISQPHLKKTILLVDDVDESRILAKWFLSMFDYSVEGVSSAKEALARFDPTLHDLVLTDNTMPGMTGAEMSLEIKKKSPKTPIIMFSGNPPHDLLCVDVVIKKPHHLLTVKEAVDHFLGPTDTPSHLQCIE